MYAKHAHVAWGGGFPRYSRYLWLSRKNHQCLRSILVQIENAVTLLICLIGIGIKEKWRPIKASEWAARNQIVCSHIVAMKWHVEHKEDMMCKHNNLQNAHKHALIDCTHTGSDKCEREKTTYNRYTQYWTLLTYKLIISPNVLIETTLTHIK